MKVLLDTLVIYRATTDPDALPEPTRALLEDESHALFVSLISAWELTIKSSLGKLSLPAPIEEFFPQATRDLLAQQLGLELKAIAKLAQLPPHHADPFDRLLIAQALADECVVVTSDARFADYGVRVVWS
jgi:PIN domain nuclease of toxin-antitoxin system